MKPIEEYFYNREILEIKTSKEFQDLKSLFDGQLDKYKGSWDKYTPFLDIRIKPYPIFRERYYVDSSNLIIVTMDEFYKRLGTN